MNRKAIGLLSGGLDSTVAIKLMLDQGIEVIAVNFMSPFCTCTGKNAGCKSEAMKVSTALGIPVKRVFLGKEYLDMVKSPEYGYGKGLNPCVDCRVMMFRKTGELMKELGASFIFTGEVLGQRPMSQRKDTMRIVERDSGLDGYILRPLCAQLLPETIPEKEGIVDRSKLLKISGRSRKEQIKIAKEADIRDYPCAAGGCLLTEKGFAGKVKDLLEYNKNYRVRDAQLLRIGRHFRLSDTCKVIVGRDEAENQQLEKMAETGDSQFLLEDHEGPFVLAQGEMDESLAPLISRILIRYSSLSPDVAVAVSQKIVGNGQKRIYKEKAIEDSRLEEFRIGSLER